jgi:hypothetical protein
VAWEQNPARREVTLRPVRLEVSKPVKKATGRFTLDCPEGLPEDGYPVTWGIPFGQGRLLDEKRVALAGPGGKPVPAQTAVLHRWPDGSIRWLLLDFQANGGSANQTYTVTYGTEVSPAPSPVFPNAPGRGHTVTYGTEVSPAPAQSGLRVREMEDAVRGGERKGGPGGRRAGAVPGTP